MSTPGDFFAEHRKTIDARKAHLARVGVNAPDVTPLRDAMPSQADALTMPAHTETPMIEATHPAAAARPEKAPSTYSARKLPKLPGVNVGAEE